MTFLHSTLYSMSRFTACSNQRIIGRLLSKHHILAALIVPVAILSGCMSLVPRKTSAVPLPNGVIEYRNPSFDNRISATGWACIAAMTAGGAYQGYHSNLKLRWTGWERKPEIQIAGNTALGAVAGLASGLLITWIVGGEAPTVTTDNAALWLEKLDDRMMLVPSSTEYPGLPLKSIQGVARARDASLLPRPGEATAPSAIHSSHDWRLRNSLWDSRKSQERYLHEFSGISLADIISADSTTGGRNALATGSNYGE